MKFVMLLFTFAYHKHRESKSFGIILNILKKYIFYLENIEYDTIRMFKLQFLIKFKIFIILKVVYIYRYIIYNYNNN